MVDLAKKKAETDDDSYEVVPKVGGGKNVKRNATDLFQKSQLV